jgi:hypothetical protein
LRITRQRAFFRIGRGEIRVQIAIIASLATDVVSPNSLKGVGATTDAICNGVVADAIGIFTRLPDALHGITVCIVDFYNLRVRTICARDLTIIRVIA